MGENRESNAEMPSLDQSNLDAAMGAADMIATLPVVSTILAPLLAVLKQWFPGQATRLADYAKKLHERVSVLENGLALLKTFVQDDAGQVLFDRIVEQVRISSEERRRRLTNLLTNSLTEGTVRFPVADKVLHTLAQLTDADVTRLYYHSQKFSLNSPLLGKFYNRYPDIAEPPSRELQVERSERDSRAIFDSYDTTLIRHGLLTEARTGKLVTEFGDVFLEYVFDDDDDAWKRV